MRICRQDNLEKHLLCRFEVIPHDDNEATTNQKYKTLSGDNPIKINPKKTKFVLRPRCCDTSILDETIILL